MDRVLLLLLMFCSSNLMAVQSSFVPAIDNKKPMSLSFSKMSTSAHNGRNSNIKNKNKLAVAPPLSFSPKRRQQQKQKQQQQSITLLQMGYVPPEAEEYKPRKKIPLYPKVGDVVRYYELDGGRSDGQELVGKITFIQKLLGGEDEKDGWLVEVVELENVGDGYYAEYPSRQRMSKKKMRNLELVSPIAASFVRPENAYKIPRQFGSDSPMVRQDQYDIDDYPGPFGTDDTKIDLNVLAADEEKYNVLKNKLLRYAAIAGFAGTLIVDLVKGTEDAIIYFAGAVASILYLFFLSIETDTIASPNKKLGKRVSNLRFLMPVIVIVGIALYNKSLGDANPLSETDSLFDTVTAEQFGAAVLGFLTYRLPLFFSQIQEAIEGGESVLPGSAGVALQLAKAQDDNSDPNNSSLFDDLTTVFLISGPQATGRSELVQEFLADYNSNQTDDDKKMVTPIRVDKMKDGITFERLAQREDFLYVDPTDRYGLTKEGIFKAAASGDTGSDGDGDDNDVSNKKVVIIDADVKLVKQLANVPGLRLIGVWVGLNSVKDFESRLEQQIESGQIIIPEEETKESVIRARVREIVTEIEYGISANIFEFTILNNDKERALQELKAAAAYCFD